MAFTHLETRGEDDAGETPYGQPAWIELFARNVTPFQHVRLWLRRAPLAQRAGAVLGAMLAMAVIAWLAVPSNHSASVKTSNGSAGGASSSQVQQTGAQSQVATPAQGSTQTEAVAGAAQAQPSEASATPGSPAGSSQPASSGPTCTAPPGSDQGVSGNEIKIAIIEVNVFGPTVNSAFGVASVSQQQGYFQDVIDAVNGAGGVACHYKLVPIYFPANAADPSSLQQTCLDIEQAGVFAVIDYGAYFQYPSLAACFPLSHIPYISVTLPPQSEQQKYYPYIFSTGSTLELLYHDTVYALHGRGFFSAANGFKKLGFVYRDCVPEEITSIEGWLQDVGVTSSQLVTYDLGCPTGFASPSDLEAAVLKFKESGVTNVTEAQTVTDFGNFTKVAQQQRFQPRYGLPDDALVAVTNSSEGPDYNNIANALAITGDRFGEEDTPGMTATAGTIKCSSIFHSDGLPPVYQQPLGAGGSACDDVWLLAGAIDHAPVLQRDALATGLAAAKSVEFSYPYGPNQFGAGVTTGQEFWRPLQFFTSCDCWRVLDPAFHQSF